MVEKIFTDARNGQKNEDLKAVVESIFDTKNMKLKSVLKPHQIAHIARAAIFAQKYNSKLMAALVEVLLELAVSNNGRGRIDMVAALKAAILSADEARNDTIRKKLLGV